MRDVGEEPADRHHFTNQGSDGNARERAEDPPAGQGSPKAAPPAGRRRPVHRRRGKGETPGGGKGNCGRSEGSPHLPARGGRAAPQGDPREDGAGRSGADAGVSTAPRKGRAGEAETPVGGKGEGGKQEERRALAGWDRSPDGERCRKTEAGAAARGDRPEAPRSARQARAARPSLGDLRTRGPGHRGRTSHPAASRRRDSGEGGKTPIPILCSNK